MPQLDKIIFLKELILKIKVNLKDVEINCDTELHTLGLDSLDIVELQLMYEEATGQITEDPTSAVNTVQDLLDIMS
jgi:acyl carrier protein